jgi:DNA-binding IscR family transcriptional regulator
MRDPGTLTLWEVVNALEPFQRITTCPLGLGSHGSHLCPLHSSLDHALGTMETLFRSMTVSQMLSQTGAATPLCEEIPLMQLSCGTLSAAMTNVLSEVPAIS